jgi:ERCC4-related helicase
LTPSVPEADPFPIREGYVAHAYLKPGVIQAREYQTQLARQALAENTLIVLPTGLGKTIIAALVLAQRLANGARRSLVLAPTRPLAQQHADAMARLFRDEGLIHLLSGATPPTARSKAWAQSLIVVATPQTVRNDLKQGRYDLADVDVVVFDEAHHAVGDYAYVEIAKRLAIDNPKALILGLTASPGAQKDRVREVQDNLGHARPRFLDEQRATVQPYIEKTDLQWIRVALPASMKRLQKLFEGVLSDRIDTLRRLHLIKGERPFGPGRKELIMITKDLGRRAGAGGGGPSVFAGLQAAQGALSAHLCLEYLETQGLVPLKRHLDRLTQKTDLKRAEKAFLADKRVQSAIELLAKGVERSHPKQEALATILLNTLKDKPDALAIVFAQYRDTVDAIIDDLRTTNIHAERFVGQGRRGEGGGMTQKEQKSVLDRFRRREFPVLVSTSVGEEGIDIPQVDLVVFFEAVPSEIRAIQRRGRTGRTAAGRVVVLVTAGTRDETALNAQIHREGRMRKIVGNQRPERPLQ